MSDLLVVWLAVAGWCVLLVGAWWVNGRRVRGEWCDDCDSGCTDDYPCACCVTEDCRHCGGRLQEDEYPYCGPCLDEIQQDYMSDDPEWEDEPDENWVTDLPPERPLELVPAVVDVPVRPEYLALSDDPELIVWDARRQAERCWEIVHVEFPALRARLADEYRDLIAA